MPFVMAVGIGLSVRNAKAVLEAIFGVKSEFARTPKFNIDGQTGTWSKKLYRNRAGWMPYLEIALGLYFAGTIVYAIQNENYATMPFLFLFVWGFLYTGVKPTTRSKAAPGMLPAIYAAMAPTKKSNVTRCFIAWHSYRV